MLSPPLWYIHYNTMHSMICKALFAKQKAYMVSSLDRLLVYSYSFLLWRLAFVKKILHPKTENTSINTRSSFHYSSKAFEYFMVPLIESSALSYSGLIINASFGTSKGACILYSIAGT